MRGGREVDAKEGEEGEQRISSRPRFPSYPISERRRTHLLLVHLNKVWPERLDVVVVPVRVTEMQHRRDREEDVCSSIKGHVVSMLYWRGQDGSGSWTDRGRT